MGAAFPYHSFFREIIFFTTFCLQITSLGSYQYIFINRDFFFFCFTVITTTQFFWCQLINPTRWTAFILGMPEDIMINYQKKREGKSFFFFSYRWDCWLVQLPACNKLIHVENLHLVFSLFRPSCPPSNIKCKPIGINVSSFFYVKHSNQWLKKKANEAVKMEMPNTYRK